jgi:uncharacterized protein (UPF0128 family)
MKNIHLIYNYYPVFPIVALYTLFSSRTQVCNKKTVTLNEITGMKREINNEDECKYKEIRDVARRITEGSRQIHRLTTEGARQAEYLGAIEMSKHPLSWEEKVRIIKCSHKKND